MPRTVIQVSRITKVWRERESGPGSPHNTLDGVRNVQSEGKTGEVDSLSTDIIKDA